ncbi:unnamed protein product [Schistocephalus solidus]|uniref:G protein-coupled receptor n=1 Tax=Schistocephalus solidus TaxID=70667 RepID=A0A183SKV4_SCHSO|nr:unnamed protein product [Schistocephalus solidus]
MQPAKFIAINIFIAKIIQTGVHYLSKSDIDDTVALEKVPIVEPPRMIPPQPSWFLPYLLTLQLSVACLFAQTLRKFELPSGRTRLILCTLITVDLIFAWMDVLQFSLYSNYAVDLFTPSSGLMCRTFLYIMDAFQHLSVCLHILLCAEVAGLLPLELANKHLIALCSTVISYSLFIPLSFEDASSGVESCTEIRSANILVNYAHRLSSLHLLPNIFLAGIYFLLRYKKGLALGQLSSMPSAKGDEELSVLNIRTFTIRSMLSHCFISLAYCLLTLGIKTRRPTLIEFIQYIDTPEYLLRKGSYLQHAANTVCLLVCLNLDTTDGELMEFDEDSDDAETIPSNFNNIFDELD